MNTQNFDQATLSGQSDRQDYSTYQERAEGYFTLDLERFWHEAISLKFWLAGLVALGLLLGTLATLLAKPLYQADARLEISQVTADVTNLDALEVESKVSEVQYLNTQYELLVSKFMAERVIEAGNLTRNGDSIGDPRLIVDPSLSRAADQSQLVSGL